MIKRLSRQQGNSPNAGLDMKGVHSQSFDPKSKDGNDELLLTDKKNDRTKQDGAGS